MVDDFALSAVFHLVSFVNGGKWAIDTSLVASVSIVAYIYIFTINGVSKDSYNCGKSDCQSIKSLSICYGIISISFVDYFSD